MAGGASVVALTGVAGPAGLPRAWHSAGSDSQALAALGATCVKNGTATAGLHAYTKAVGALAAGY